MTAAARSNLPGALVAFAAMSYSSSSAAPAAARRVFRTPRLHAALLKLCAVCADLGKGRAVHPELTGREARRQALRRDRARQDASYGSGAAAFPTRAGCSTGCPARDRVSSKVLSGDSSAMEKKGLQNTTGCSIVPLKNEDGK